MKCFIKGAPKSCLTDRSELKAVLVALVACLLFIGFLTISAASRNRRHVVQNRSYRVPPPPIKLTPAPELVTEVPPTPADLNARFRVAPRHFARLDFRNRSLGDYQLSNGKVVDLALVGGQFRDFGSSSHWFDFNDAFYTDLTGDGTDEAIVMLTHLECAQTCDGGKNLVYVYSQDQGYFNEILKYETGSGIDGCSLKSLNVENKQLALELYGRCPQPSGISSDTVRHETYDVTRVDFRFNGKKLVERKTTHFTLPDCGEVNYGVQVHISDHSSPVKVTIPKPCNKKFGMVNVD